MNRSASWWLCASLVALGCGAGQAPAEQEPIVLDESTPNEPDETGAGELVVGEDTCTTDADCVPAGCCHPAACVAQANAPSCADTMCTTDCRFGTLDCGGACLCHEGRCAARLSEAPEMTPPG